MYALKLVLFFLIILPCLSWGINESEIDWSSMTELDVLEYSQQKQFQNRVKDYKNLVKAKSALINGNIKNAKFFLSKINNEKTNLKKIKTRYLALIYFIDGEYEKSVSLLEQNSFNSLNHYSQICQLKIINYLMLNNEKKLKKEISICHSNLSKWSTSNFLWSESIYKLIAKDRKSLSGNDLKKLSTSLDDIEIISLWLKLGLYTNREDFIIENLKELPAYAFKSNRIRELISFAYYRQGDQENTNKFIEDIYGPNAENIKGNINLEKKKYELAYGHFKLALLKKENSSNAIERALPLAWILNQWDDGIEMLLRISDKKVNKQKKLALNTAFKLRQENYVETQKQLKILSNQYQKKLPKELSLMYSYTALKLKDLDKLKKYSYDSCKSLDGISCWVTGQLSIWENLSKTIDRTDKIVTSDDLTVGMLKVKPEKNHLNEIIYVDQRDIEELDSVDVKIHLEQN